MSDVLESEGLRRWVRNVLLSQKRFQEAADLSRQHVEEFVRFNFSPERNYWMYVDGYVDVDEWEQLVETALRA